MIAVGTDIHPVTPASEAVVAALHGHGTLRRPDARRVLLDARCRSGHLLGRVISTRIGPVWVARPREAPSLALMAAKDQGYHPAANYGWEFVSLRTPSVCPTR